MSSLNECATEFKMSRLHSPLQNHAQIMKHQLSKTSQSCFSSQRGVTKEAIILHSVETDKLHILISVK
jgi:hypothetical protein